MLVLEYIRMKYLVINLSRELKKNLYIENHKILMKETEEDTIYHR